MPLEDEARSGGGSGGCWDNDGGKGGGGVVNDAPLPAAGWGGEQPPPEAAAAGLEINECVWRVIWCRKSLPSLSLPSVGIFNCSVICST